MRGGAAGAFFCSLLALTAGCAAPGESPTSADVAAIGANTRPPVVALIDSGVNPYHEVFASSRPVPPLVDASTGEAARLFELSSLPELDAALDADADDWEAVKPRTLYSFTGTRISAISFYDAESNARLILDDEPHGTSVAGVVATLAHDAHIVMIEVTPNYCDVAGPAGENALQDSCVVPESLESAVEWAAAQPWIDVISMSFGTAANHPSDVMDRIAVHTRAAVDAGKVVVAGAGNAPPPALVGSPAAPPWVVSVGGAQAEERGATVLAALQPDVVAQYYGRFAGIESRSDYRTAAGTSYSTPVVAATIADAMFDLRGRVDPSGGTSFPWRAALNVSAQYWTPETWRPAPPTTSTDAFEVAYYAAARTVPVVAPAAQMGWGFVDNSTAEEMVRRILEQDLSVPSEKAPHVPAIEAAYRAREEYWRARLGG